MTRQLETSIHLLITHWTTVIPRHWNQSQLHLEHGGLWAAQLEEGGLSCCHLYDGATQGPDVSWLAIATGTLINDFRGHVLQGACKRKKGREPNESWESHRTLFVPGESDISFPFRLHSSSCLTPPISGKDYYFNYSSIPNCPWSDPEDFTYLITINY